MSSLGASVARVHGLLFRVCLTLVEITPRVGVERPAMSRDHPRTSQNELENFQKQELVKGVCGAEASSIVPGGAAGGGGVDSSGRCLPLGAIVAPRDVASGG